MDLYEFTEAAPTAPATTSSSETTTNANSANIPPASEQPSLNEEVQQALGSLGSWWGGFRKQSSVALASARKDFGQVVQQAQREIGKLATQATSPPTSPRASTSTSAPPGTEEVTPSDSNEATGTITSEDATGNTAAEAQSTTAAPSLFSFIPTGLAQNLSAAPSQIQTTLQRTLATPEIQTLRNNLSTNLTSFQTTVTSTVQSSVQTVQSTVTSVQSNAQVQNLASSVQSLPSSVVGAGLSLNKVEGFVMEKGEEFWKGAGEFFREAVKIVPPSEEELAARARGAGGVGVFDGAGVWMFDDLGGDADDADEDGDGDGDLEGKGDEEKWQVEGAKGKMKAAGGGAGVAVSRTAALLKQLRGDPALLRVDPSEGEAFGWFLKELEGKGVSVESEAWVGKCAGEEGRFEELKVTKETLVPDEMDETTFWKRYWFRAWQIREAEEKRKALLQATATLQKDEDFTWEDEEDENSSANNKTENQTPLDQSTPTPSISIAIPASSHPESTEMKSAAAAAAAAEGEAKKSGSSGTGTGPGGGASSSPRESSEDSYDLVSTRSGNASGTALAIPALASVLEKEEGSGGGVKSKGKKEKEGGEEGEEGDSGDSDWE